MKMLTYPLTYVITVLPETASRWFQFLSASGSNTLTQDSVPSTIVFAAHFVYRMAPAVTALLYWWTRPEIPFFGTGNVAHGHAPSQSVFSIRSHRAEEQQTNAELGRGHVSFPIPVINIEDVDTDATQRLEASMAGGAHEVA
ncbi:hypothetical protein OE88DRAFT_1655994 [Heliocybe sulcata]|uniref:Uncharacterized protein n=1 Tax=Heliocybe sulcata TaxID=5364 RepID=A0A5C3N7P9_9AGAM|nr:hypothetical protein OE88DRAFT_1655994 [Heliocybe sulcata]